MNIQFAPKAWNDYQYWLEKDKRKLKKANDLIKSASRTPETGIGQPEPLRGDLSGWWSRHIDKKNRLVYRVGGTGRQQTLEIKSLRDHY